MIRAILIFLPLFFVNGLFSQQIKAYQLYNSKGKKISFEKMNSSLKEKDIILFGELHNNPIAHWMQLELTKTLNKEEKITLGAEMLESDNQDALNKYISSEIDQKGLDTLARLWSNYKTDYKPLVDYAKSNDIDFIATNIPRRYASLVYKKSFEALDSLSNEEKEWIAPLPILYDPELSSYKKMLTMMSDHANENFPKAQAIKDATMAHFIYENFKENNSSFLHFNGAYHSDNYEGIYWYLKQLNDELNISTITTVSQKDVSILVDENKNVADFILVVDEDMTTTH
ncbi:MAG: ChaN family lipoprotein [Brumimicrobium sp.]